MFCLDALFNSNKAAVEAISFEYFINLQQTDGRVEGGGKNEKQPAQAAKQQLVDSLFTPL